MRIIRFTLSTLAIWCVTVSLAGAVNIYDVIELSRQGYGDEEIVDIVRTTRSVFKLTAPDIPRLKELGVSEAVIRVMLDSGPADLSGAGSVPSVKIDRDSIPAAVPAIANLLPDNNAESNAPLRADSHPHTDFDEHGNATTLDRFALQAVSEEAAGDHQHMYVTMLGAPVLILRDEGRYRSVEDRGTAIVQNLEEAVRLGDGGFRLLRTGDAIQVVYHSVDLREVPIITLDRKDVYAYDVRSDRSVTSYVLASYWAALFNDYWAILVQHRPPSRLVNLRRGAALKPLYEIVNATDSDQEGHLEFAIEQLPVEIRRHLERLATTVPDDFNPFPAANRDTS
jgi:hypothetical protein